MAILVCMNEQFRRGTKNFKIARISCRSWQSVEDCDFEFHEFSSLSETVNNVYSSGMLRYFCEAIRRKYETYGRIICVKCMENAP